MACAVPGLILIFRQRIAAAILPSSFFASLLVLLIFFVNSRYRLPLASAAIIMAGGGMDYLLKNAKQSGAYLLMAACVFLISLPLFSPLKELQLKRTHGDYWALLGAAYKDNNSFKKALWAYEKAINMNPENFRYYLIKVQLLSSLERDKEEIYRWGQDATHQLPPGAPRHIFLAEVYSVLGDNDKTMKAIEQVLASNGLTYEMYLRLGLLSGKMGKHHLARDVLFKGLQLHPENIDLQYNYIIACLKSGDRAEATKWAGRIKPTSRYFYKVRRLLEQLQGEQ
jgi:tetratricopeptide (TPR) repeat protein